MNQFNARGNVAPARIIKLVCLLYKWKRIKSGVMRHVDIINKISYCVSE